MAIYTFKDKNTNSLEKSCMISMIWSQEKKIFSGTDKTAILHFISSTISFHLGEHRTKRF